MRTIIIGAAALLGLAVGDLSTGLPRTPLVMAAALAALGAALSWRDPPWRTAALAACVAALGALCAAAVPAPAPGPLEPYTDGVVRLRGVVTAVSTRTAGSARLMLEVTAVGSAGRDPPPAPESD